MLGPLLAAAVGASTGWLAGAVGAGGAFATIALLVAAGVPVHTAVGTSLVYVLVIGGWGTMLHLRQRTAVPRLAFGLGVPAAITAVAGAWIGDALPERVLTVGLGSVMAMVVVVMLIRGNPIRPIAGGGVDTVATQMPAAIAGGACIGVMQGMFGVGGGFLLVPYLLIVLRVDERRAAGTSLFAIFLGSLVGAIAHASLGNVDVRLALVLGGAGIVGSSVGTRFARTAQPRALRAIFLLVLVAATVYMFVRGATG